FELICGSRDQASTACSEGMSNGDCSTGRIDKIRVFGKTKLAQHRNRLRCERLVQLEKLNIAQLERGLCKHFACGRRRSNAHYARLDPDNGGGEYASFWA